LTTTGKAKGSREPIGSIEDTDMEKTMCMGIDQYGQGFHDLGKFPRKELCERLGVTSAKRMYQEDSEGNSYHIGYIVAGLWVTLYSVTRWRKSWEIPKKQTHPNPARI
jgi:hypothetical protein